MSVLRVARSFSILLLLVPSGLRSQDVYWVPVEDLRGRIVTSFATQIIRQESAPTDSVILKDLMPRAVTSRSVLSSTQDSVVADSLDLPDDGSPLSTTASFSIKIFAVTNANVFYSTDDGLTWSPTLSPLDSVATGPIRADTLGHIFIPSREKIFVSSDSGDTWSTSTVVPSWATNFAGFTALPSGYLFYALHTGISRSTDFGHTWSYTNLSAVANDVVALPNGYLCFGGGYLWFTGAGYVVAGYLYTSTDRGDSWQQGQQGIWRSFQIDGSRGLIAEGYEPWAGGYLQRIVRFGPDFWKSYMSFPADHYTQLATDLNGVIFGGVGHSVMRSFDAGATWQNVTDGLPSFDVRAIHITPTNRILLSTSLGTYRIGSRPTSIAEPATALPVDWAHPIRTYPNPFNPQTTIEFHLLHPGPVKLTIFNPLGQEVAVIADREFVPGLNRVVWDASRFPSGTYFCTITSPLGRTTKRLLLLR